MSDVRPLSTDEENALRDFYARRTTRVSMGPSESIPRLLATLDATRNAAHNIAALGHAALAASPAPEPRCRRGRNHEGPCR